MLTVGTDYQFRVQGPDGTAVYAGAGQVADTYNVFCDEVSTVVLQAGEGCRIDVTDTVVPRFERVAAGAATPADIPQTETMKVLRLSALTDVCLPGVALGDVRGQSTGQVACAGSIVCVKTTATTITVGQPITGSATAGSASGDSTPLIGEVLGMCVKTNLVASPGTGSATQAGVLICPR